MQMSEKIEIALEAHQIECMENEKMQEAIQKYVEEHDLYLPQNITYSFGIDFYDVRVDDKPVLIVSLPPMSDYEIEETKFTRRYLHRVAKTA